MRVPTRKVTNADGQAMVINVEDFDPKVHLAGAGGEELEAPALEPDVEPEAKVEVAPKDGSEFNFDIPEDAVKGQDFSAVVPGPELPKA